MLRKMVVGFQRWVLIVGHLGASTKGCGLCHTSQWALFHKHRSLHACFHSVGDRMIWTSSCQHPILRQEWLSWLSSVRHARPVSMVIRSYISKLRKDIEQKHQQNKAPEPRPQQESDIFYAWSTLMFMDRWFFAKQSSLRLWIFCELYVWYLFGGSHR